MLLIMECNEVLDETCVTHLPNARRAEQDGERWLALQSALDGLLFMFTREEPRETREGVGGADLGSFACFLELLAGFVE